MATTRGKLLVPADLTIPKPGSTTARQVLGDYLKRTLRDLFAFPTTRFHSNVADDFADLRAGLQRMLKSGNAGPVFALIRRPTISTLIRCIDAELWGKGDPSKLDTWLTELTALIAFELAANGELAEPGIQLRTQPGRLLSIEHGIEINVDSSYRLGFIPGKLVLANTERRELALETLLHAQSADVPGLSIARPYHPIVPGIALAVADNNPLSDFEAHPEKQGNQIDLGGRDVEEWTGVLREAFALIRDYLPDLADEIQLVMQLLVPVGFDEKRHLSASYMEAIGTAYLTLHPDLVTLAEAIIHEFSHNKINAAWRLDPVLHNAFHPLFESPIRPDPRPLYGVLLAVHAFTPVAALYERMLDDGHPRTDDPAFARRFRSIVEGNHDAVTTLTNNAKPTTVGRAILDELSALDEHFMQRIAAL